jgi:hypothetical protein
VSNYSWVATPWVSVGAEVVNGTGDVIIQAETGEGDDSFLKHMTADEALELGNVLVDQAWEAKRAHYAANRAGTPARQYDRALAEARARFQRLRVAAETPSVPGSASLGDPR